MTTDEMNRKISEIRDEWYFYDYDGSREPKCWLYAHNAMKLLKEMLTEGRELCIGHWIDAEKRPDKQFYVENDLGNLVGLAETVEAAICAAWLKWKEAK